jgi:hypothetical protein
MSSTLRTVAQIPPRIKYLQAVADGDTDSDTVTDDACFGFTCTEGAFSESVVPTGSAAQGLATAISGFGQASYNTGDHFKDLGRQLVIYDARTKLHVAIFRQVLGVNGVDTEGVGAVPPSGEALYVKVWSATGGGVRVARTGAGAH